MWPKYARLSALFFLTHSEDFDVRPVAHLLHQAQRFPLGDGDGAQDAEGRAVQRLSHRPDEGLAEELHFADLVDDKHLPVAFVRTGHLEEERIGNNGNRFISLWGCISHYTTLSGDSEFNVTQKYIYCYNVTKSRKLGI